MAVLLVVLFHAGVSFVSGGFVGVDVFFVISGFVITGVLMRERASTGRTSILSFYGRRARRIIPAATLVIIVTVALAFLFLDIEESLQTAGDGRWAAVFLANFHFAAHGTNYLASSLPPSPLQNFWSLAVEEQFYLVYPTLFLLVAALKVSTFRVRMAICLVAVICVSLIYSIQNTHADPISAFFSPFTRAWELALGALVAISTPWLAKLPTRLAAGTSWLGLVAVGVAAFVFTSQTAYPGSLVIIPVVGAALIISGGAAAPLFGAESLLRLPPFRWLGKVSYSLYLWHWPILIIAAEYAGKTTLSVKDNLGWMVLALVISVITYRALENPVRHAPLLRRSRWASVGLGVGLIGLTLVSITALSGLVNVPAVGRPVGSLAALRIPDTPLRSVLHDVDISAQIRSVPADLNPSVADMLVHPRSYIGYPRGFCTPSTSGHSVPACTFGHGSHTLVLYGDSHAGMWFAAIEADAARAHWKVVVLFKPGCPASLVHVPELTNTSGDWTACDEWHRFAVKRIRQVHPSLLIVSQNEGYFDPNGQPYSPKESKLALEHLLRTLPAKREVVIGNPAVPQYGTADCLAQHTTDVQACSGPPGHAYVAFNRIEQSAAKAVGARFVDVVPWLCARSCSPVVGGDGIYLDTDHVSIGYSLILKGVMAKALGLQPVSRRGQW